MAAERSISTTCIFMCYSYINKIMLKTRKEIWKMPVIRVPDSTYKRLQQRAEPFVDTPADVIDRLLDEYEIHRSIREDVYEAKRNASVRVLDPDTYGELSHTKVLSAQVGDIKVKRPDWAKLVRTVHQIALQRGSSIEALNRITLSNIRKGEHRGDGFHYLPEEDVSIQGMQADKAWRDALHLARHLDVKIEVTFEWRDKEGAAYPGERGKVFWYPG